MHTLRVSKKFPSNLPSTKFLSKLELMVSEDEQSRGTSISVPRAPTPALLPCDKELSPSSFLLPELGLMW